MHLIDHLASGCLVQAVDILRDHALELSFCLHFSQLVMRLVGQDSPGIHLLPVKLIKDLGLSLQAGIAQQVFRLIGIEPDIVLIVQSVLAPEIRDPALC